MSDIETKIHLNYIRVISCILVVTVHVSANQYDSISPRSLEWNVMNFYDCLGILGVPLFVMISGSLMISSPKSNSIGYILKKSFKLFMLYYIWAFIYKIIFFLENGSEISYLSIKDDIVLDTLIEKVHYHLWFFPMLIALYLLVPIMKQLCSSISVMQYCLVMNFVIVLFFQTICSYDFPYRTIVQATLERIPITFFAHYVGYFILGYYLESYACKFKKSNCFILYGASIFSFACVVFLCGYDAYLKNETSVIVNNPLTVFHFIACSGVYVFFKRQTACFSRFPSIVNRIAPLTLGIYLVHPFLIDGLANSGVTTLLIPPLFSIPLIVGIVVLGSAVITYIFSKVPVVSQLFR